MGFADFPVEAMKILKVHPDTKKRKKSSDTSKKGTGSSTDLSGDIRSGSVADSQLTASPSASTTTLTPSVSTDTNRHTPSSTPRSQSQAGSSFTLSESLASIQGSDTPTESQTSGSSSTGRNDALRSMGAALRNQLDEHQRRGSAASGSQSPSSHERRPSGAGAQKQKDSSDPIETVLSTGKGVQRMLGASFRSPMDFSLSLAKGFHNAPKLYGDKTVRKTEPVTDFRSGLKAAGKGFGLGLYDGISGLVTQPIAGAKEEGAAGFIKGFGKGIGGIVMKPSAGVWAIPGYTMKGLFAEMTAQSGASIQNYIIAARVAQGYADWHDSNEPERVDVIRRWESLRGEIKRKKDVDKALADWYAEHKGAGKAWKQERAQEVTGWKTEQKRKIRDQLKSGEFGRFLNKTKANEREDGGAVFAEQPGASNASQQRSGTGSAPRHADSTDSALSRSSHVSGASELPTETSPVEMPASLEAGARFPTSQEPLHDPELDEAIRASVAESSRGNADEDALIERALKVSIAELQARGPPASRSDKDDDEEEEAIRTALAQSVLEAEHYRTRASDQSAEAGEDDADLQRAIDESLRNQQSSPTGHDGATEASRSVRTIPRKPVSRQHSEQNASQSMTTQDHDEELEKAMRESKLAHEDKEKQAREEEIVMEYVRKQSLLEQSRH